MRNFIQQWKDVRTGDMKGFLFFFLALLMICLTSFTNERLPNGVKAEKYKLPLTFEKNEGQIVSDAAYFTRGNGYALYFNSHEIVFHLQNQAEKFIPYAQLKIQFAGATKNPNISGKEEQETKSNYLIGNNPEKWRTNISHFAKVSYDGLYPGIDAIFYGNQEQLEYDFSIAPGADPSNACLHFEGAKNLVIDENGDLLVSLENSKVKMNKPVVYQVIDEKQVHVNGKFILLAKDDVGFDIGVYDLSKTLIIDPVISFSSFLGGSNIDGGLGTITGTTGGSGRQDNMSIAVDCEGNSYICGQTASTNYPTTTGAVQTNFGTGTFDACVTKINPDGTKIIFSTFLGGNNYSGANAIAVDACRNVYITGQTTSTDFPGTGSATIQPTTTGFQQQIRGTKGNAFLTKLDPTGQTILYSTYCGGLGEGGGNFPTGVFGDVGSVITVDNCGNAYFAGSTSSFSFPVTPHAFQTTYGGGPWDAFVTKVDTCLTGAASLIYSTYLGGNNTDRAFGIAIDSCGNAYVTGQTNSSNFPVVNALQPVYGGGSRDCFLTKINPYGSGLIFSTYCGGTGNDRAFGISLDGCNNIYITGQTTSTAGSNPSNPNFPSTANAFQPNLAGTNLNAFVTKFNAEGSKILASTYFGGSTPFDGNTPQTYATSLRVDRFGFAYITGLTAVTDLPTMNPTQSTFGGGLSDAFVAKFNPDLSQLVFSTYLGGSSDDLGYGIALDKNGSVYVAGATASSTTFPITPGVFQPTYGGGASDIFVTKYLFLVFPPQNLIGFQGKRGGKNVDILEWDAPTKGFPTLCFQVAKDPCFDCIIGTIPGGCPCVKFITKSNNLRKRHKYFVRTIDNQGNASEPVQVVAKSKRGLR